ncbi:MAG TPA: hypothetical protein VJ790_17840 [Dongiaceae bacterium]|nr:hypothetical protein [Dongiaceae bacterium]
MSWLLHLPSICASTLLFCLIGSPLGGVMFLTGWAIGRGHPLSFGEEVAFLAATFGAAPAFVTGILAGILRIHVRSLLLLAFLMAPVGALVTAIYLVVFMMLLGIGVPWIDKVILIGGLSAFGCSFLLWRNRPWLILPR